MGYALLFALCATPVEKQEGFDRGRAFTFNLHVSIVLALTVALVLLVSSVLNAALGRAGLVLGTATDELADSQSAAISAATLSHVGQIGASEAALARLAALSANTLSMAVIAAMLGKRRVAAGVWPGLGLILAGAWGGWARQRGVSRGPVLPVASPRLKRRAGAARVSVICDGVICDGRDALRKLCGRRCRLPNYW